MNKTIASVLIILLGTQLAAQNCIQSLGDFNNLSSSNLFSATPDTVGFVNQKEISGIAPSKKYPGYFWGINDSGNGAVLYLYSLTDASLRGLFILSGITNIDWEDLTYRINKNDELTLYIPDIGDNKAKRKAYSIYQISEPEISSPEKKINNIKIDAIRIPYTYENGSRDAEAIAFDPVDQKLKIISKRESKVHVYSLSPQQSDSVISLPSRGTLPISNVVAADFSQDGMKLLVKTYTNVYLWERKTEEEPFCEMISRLPQKVNYRLEPQGESICFIDDEFITVSEERFGITPILYRYKTN